MIKMKIFISQNIKFSCYNKLVFCYVFATLQSLNDHNAISSNTKSYSIKVELVD